MEIGSQLEETGQDTSLLIFEERPGETPQEASERLRKIIDSTELQSSDDLANAIYQTLLARTKTFDEGSEKHQKILDKLWKRKKPSWENVEETRDAVTRSTLRKNIQAQSKKLVPEGFDPVQGDAAKKILFDAAIYCSLDEKLREWFKDKIHTFFTTKFTIGSQGAEAFWEDKIQTRNVREQGRWSNSRTPVPDVLMAQKSYEARAAKTLSSLGSKNAEHDITSLHILGNILLWNITSTRKIPNTYRQAIEETLLNGRPQKETIVELAGIYTLDPHLLPRHLGAIAMVETYKAATR